MIVKGRPYCHRLAAHSLGENGEDGTPKGGKGDTHQQEVIEQEGALARDDRVELLFWPQPGQTIQEDHDDGEEGKEIRTNRRVGKRVHRTDDAAAHLESTEDGERK